MYMYDERGARRGVELGPAGEKGDLEGTEGESLNMYICMYMCKCLLYMYIYVFMCVCMYV